MQWSQLLFTDGENGRVTGQVSVPLKDVIWRARVDDVMVYTVAFYGESSIPVYQDLNSPAGRDQFGREEGEGPQKQPRTNTDSKPRITPDSKPRINTD